LVLIIIWLSLPYTTQWHITCCISSFNNLVQCRNNINNSMNSCHRMLTNRTT